MSNLKNVNKGRSDDPSSKDISSSDGIANYSTFESMELKENLLRGIYAYGIEKPSAVQQRAIKPIIQGRDVIVQTQSGTGKTSVIPISVLQALDASNETQALVISPTRELVEQTQKMLFALGNFMSFQCHACLHDNSVGEDIERLDAGVQVVVGTPDCALDMIRRKKVRIRAIKLLVFDGADEMLNECFGEQIYDIYRRFPPSIQVVVVTAALSEEVLDMSNKCMKNPIRVLKKKPKPSAPSEKVYDVNKGLDLIKDRVPTYSIGVKRSNEVLKEPPKSKVPAAMNESIPCTQINDNALSKYSKTRVVKLPENLSSKRVKVAAKHQKNNNIRKIANIIGDQDMFNEEFESDSKHSHDGGYYCKDAELDFGSKNADIPVRGRFASRDRAIRSKVDMREEKLSSHCDAKQNDFESNSCSRFGYKGYSDEESDDDYNRGKLDAKGNQNEAKDAPTMEKNKKKPLHTPKHVADAASNAEVVEANLLRDIDHRHVERRTIGGVSMSQQVTSAKRLQEKLNSKPELLRIMAERKALDTKKQVFYGPQLPVPWVQEKENHRKRPENADSDSDESISEDILQWLESRKDNKEKEIAKEVSATADAYLTSSIAGSLLKKSRGVFMKPTNSSVHTNKVAASIIAMNKAPPKAHEQFIGPQLPVDWGQKLEGSDMRYKSHSLQMGLSTGRDARQVLKKGQQKVINFNAPLQPSTLSEVDEPEDIPDIGGFGGMNGMGVRFDKQISRANQVGPFGEKPIASQIGGLTGDIRKDRAIMNELLREEGLDIMDIYENDANNGELDLEVEHARDTAAQHGRIDNSHLLYAKERHVEPKIDPNAVDADENRTEWFKGFADDVKSRPGADLVKFDLQVGRHEQPTDKKAKDQKNAELKAMIRENDEFGLDFDDGAGDGLDLDEDVENAIKKKYEVRTKHLEFRDVKKYPKFEGVSKKELEELELRQRRDEINMEKPNVKDIGYKIQNVVDMSKQQGRAIEQEGDIVEAEVNGDVNLEAALLLEGELDKQRDVGHGFQSHVKKTKFFTNFDKQDSVEHVNKTDIAHAVEFGEDVEVKQFKDTVESATPATKHVGNEWDKQRGRNEGMLFGQRGDHGGDNELELLQQQIGVDEGRILELEVNPAVKSNWERTPTAPDFDRQSKPNDKAQLDKAGVELLADIGVSYVEKGLELEDINPRKFKKGGDPVKSNAICMDKQVHVPRMNPPPMGANKDVLGDEYEELDLIPDTKASSKTKKAASHKWSETKLNRGAEVDVVYDSETKALLEGEKLMLSPDVDITRERVLNPPAWTESESVRDKKMAEKILRDSIEKSLGMEYSGAGAVGGDTLDIAPDYDAGKSLNELASLKWSAAADVHPPPSVNDLLKKMKMDSKKGNTAYKSLKADNAEDMELLEMLVPEGLVLDETNDSVIKGRTKGVVQWSDTTKKQNLSAGVDGGVVADTAAKLIAQEKSLSKSVRKNRLQSSANGPDGEDMELLELLRVQSSTNNLVLSPSDDQIRTKPHGNPSWKPDSNPASQRGSINVQRSSKQLKQEGVPEEIIESTQELILSPDDADKKKRVKGGGFSKSEKMQDVHSSKTNKDLIKRVHANPNGRITAKNSMKASPVARVSLNHGMDNDEEALLSSLMEEQLQLSARSDLVKKPPRGGSFSKSTKSRAKDKNIKPQK